ncbi:putative DNA binding domain-containing protein [Chromobacterium violaceum]|uniref:ATP-binding protein n=1 Tax=Chromobacterium violaceum TaxID=536 RepID=UPI001E43FA13|nr:ATP-binding protein [Chromobacterium violaceum]MCD0494347.1 putative DNA binding domain-containing protein [Chromobacterium violaceum]
MDQLLKLKDKVEIAVEIGESYYREFKSAYEGKPGNKEPRDIKEIKYDIAKTLVAFANADGGELFIGIEDDCSITGIPHADEKIGDILNSYKDCVMKETPVNIKQAAIIAYQDKKVIYYSVSKGSEFVHLTSKGECFQRKDRESVPTATEHISYERSEKISREYDRQFVDIAKITDLDIDLVQNVGNSISKSISPEKLLQYFDLAEFDGDNFKLRRAALLLFSKRSTKWHPRSQVRILKVRGIEEKTGKDFNLTEVGEANGNIFHLIESSWDQLRPHLTDTRLSDDALFKTQIMYPELACREALINAITHRDYSNEGRGIEVKIFDDRLQIENPGQLLSTISQKDIENLTGAHQSRNTYIARVLRETGYIRELGEGIRRIFELMRSNDMVAPKILSGSGQYSITLHHKYIFTKEEQLWLENFKTLNLTREQQTVVRLGINSKIISAKEIFENVGIVDEKAYRELIESLRRINILTTKYTTNEVSRLKNQYGGSRKAVPRFIIHLPNQKQEVEQGSTPEEYSKIFVRNLNYISTAEKIASAFEKFGDISHVDIKIKNGKNPGWCIVEFEKKTGVVNALNSSDPICIDGRKLHIDEAR